MIGMGETDVSVMMQSDRFKQAEFKRRSFPTMLAVLVNVHEVRGVILPVTHPKLTLPGATLSPFFKSLSFFHRQTQPQFWSSTSSIISSSSDHDNDEKKKHV
jgi:hypothetical protein